MRQILLSAVALAFALALGGCLHAPMPWSPDGKWMAYTVQVRPPGPMLRPGWLFEPATSLPTPAKVSKAASGPYRLWATRGDGAVSVMLEESSQPITAPGWSPDGHSLAFGRVVAEADGSGRFEVVVLEGPSRRRVVASRVLPEIDAEAARLPGQAIVWSPDGRYLAIPQLRPLGLAIIRADNGRQVNAINDGFLPSWSPDGARLAFYIRGTGDSLHCIDSALGQPRPLTEVGQAGQAPAWTRDSLAVLVVARKPMPRGAEPPTEFAELLRVRVDSGQVETVRMLTADSGLARDRPIEGISIAFDREGENLFSSMVAEGQPHQLTWYRPRDNAIYKKFSILDRSTPTASLSLSPDGRTLAARIGSADRLSPPVFCDLESSDLRGRLIAPDDSSRVEWIATMVASARTILAALPAASVDPRNPASTRVERPTLLPVLGEFEINSETVHRLRGIGRMGRPLCDRPADAPVAEPGLIALLDEARLFFDYLREDYSAAIASLEVVEGRAESPDQRLRLLSVRAQIFLAQGKLEQAARTIAYLQSHERKPSRRVEWTAAGYALTSEPEVGQGWPTYLAARAELVRAMLHDEAPNAQPEPGSPRPGLGLDLPMPRPNLILPERPFFIDAIPPRLPGAPGDFPNPRPVLRPDADLLPRP